MKYQIPKRAISSVLDHLMKEGRKERGARILLYHSVGKRGQYDTLGLRTTEECFAEQMEYLSRSLYTVVSLPSLLDMIVSGNPVTHKTVAITFDDGYRDNRECAFPVLQEYDFPATFFITADSRSKRLAGNNGEYWTAWEYLSQEEIRELASSNNTVGSHSFSHNVLTCKGTELYRELFESKEILEQKIGKKVSLFSYPHGMFNKGIKEALAEAGYESACSSIIGCNTSSTDVFELKRTEITGFDTIEEFERKLSGYYDWLGYFQRKKYCKEKGRWFQMKGISA